MAIVPNGEEIGHLDYGGVDSRLFWLSDEALTIEMVDLGSNNFLLRGAKHYYISEAVQPDFSTRLASVGTFSDYLKEHWPSFEISMLYVNTLSTAMSEKPDKKKIKEDIENKKRSIKSDEQFLKKLRNDLQYDLSTQSEISSYERKIREQKTSLDRDENNLKLIEQFEREFKKKGNASTFIIKRQSDVHICNKKNIENTVNIIVQRLTNDKKTIKEQARHGLNIGLEELKVPITAWNSESMGIFDPRILEAKSIEHPEFTSVIEPLKETIEKTFNRRWATESVAGESRVSAANAQAIASLLSKISQGKQDYLAPSPDWKKLPKYHSNRREGFLGLVMDGNLEVSKYPFYIDYDTESNYAALGTTRFGKTIAASVFVEGAVAAGIPVIVIDPTKSWTGMLEKCEYQEFLNIYPDFQMKEPTGLKGRIFTVGSDVGIKLSTNLLSPPPPKFKENWLEIMSIELSDIISRLCSLTEKQKTKVSNIITESWKSRQPLDYESLIERTNGNLKQSLSTLRGYPFLFSGESIEDITSLWKEKEVSVVSLNHLEKSQRMWAAYYLLRKIVEYFDRQPESKKTKLIVVIEEVHQFKKEAQRILETATRELLKRGVRVVLVTQKLTDIESSRGNVASRFYFKQWDDNEVDRVVGEVGGDYKKVFNKLEKGMAVVSLPDYDPFLVKFRPPFHRSKELKDHEIASVMTKWKNHPIVFENLEDIEKGEMTEEQLFIQTIKTLHNTNKEYPYFNEVKRELNWGAGKATRIKNELIKKGNLKEIKDGKVKRLVPQ